MLTMFSVLKLKPRGPSIQELCQPGRLSVQGRAKMLTSMKLSDNFSLGSIQDKTWHQHIVDYDWKEAGFFLCTLSKWEKRPVVELLGERDISIHLPCTVFNLVLLNGTQNTPVAMHVILEHLPFTSPTSTSSYSITLLFTVIIFQSSKILLAD